MTVTVAHNKFGVATADVEASTYPSGTGGHVIAIPAGREADATPVDAGTEDWGTAHLLTIGTYQNAASFYSRDGDPDDDTWDRISGSNSEVGVIYLRDDAAAATPWTAAGSDEAQGFATSFDSPVIANADIDGPDFLAILVVLTNNSAGITTWPAGFTERVNDFIGSAEWYADEIYIATRYVTGHSHTDTDYDPGAITIGASDIGDTLLLLVETDTSVELEQFGFRWREDDGSETGATWAAAEDTNITAPAGKKRARIGVATTGDLDASKLKAEVRLDGGAWFDAPVRGS